MRHIFIICAIILTAFLISSCEKCITCSYEIDGQVKSEDYCGNSNDVNSFIDSWESTSKFSGSKSSHCIEK